ncbi:MAG TPA: hypothetical protein VHD76_11755 [Bryobacteraceae bacterium]|nr:hypothetical protein [Bryobacteraceae bacterium]
MKIGIVSWNIRHLRPQKVADYIDYITPRLIYGRIAILYENKIDNNQNDELCDLLAQTMVDKMPDSVVECKSLAVPVGTNENVVVVYVSKCKTGPNSKTPNTNISIEVRHNPTFDQQLATKGQYAMEHSYNETVMANIQMARADFRIPAILEVKVTKQGQAAKIINIMAWHAPGPATGLPPLLWNVFQPILYNHVDLYVGDFNMTGLKGKAPITPICLHRTNQSTTFTKGGPVPHAEGLDLVFRNHLRIGDRAMPVQVDDEFIGRATVQVIAPGGDLDTAFDVSDHLPVYIELKEV